MKIKLGTICNVIILLLSGSLLFSCADPKLKKQLEDQSDSLISLRYAKGIKLKLNDSTLHEMLFKADSMFVKLNTVLPDTIFADSGGVLLIKISTVTSVLNKISDTIVYLSENNVTTLKQLNFLKEDIKTNALSIDSVKLFLSNEFKRYKSFETACVFVENELLKNLALLNDNLSQSDALYRKSLNFSKVTDD